MRMNFKPTSTKSIVSAIAPLIVAVAIFNKNQNKTMAAVILIGLCIAIYIAWSIIEKQEQIYNI
jgi:uncharacterized membrane protein